jgi:hypothetical protein
MKEFGLDETEIKNAKGNLINLASHGARPI